MSVPLTHTNKQAQNPCTVVESWFYSFSQQNSFYSFAFSGLDLPQVELQFLAFQHVAISSATLSRSGGNAGCKEKSPS